MKIRLKAINDDIWQTVENGYNIQIPGSPTPDEKKLVQLDAQAKDVICSYLSRMQFIHFGRFDYAKEISDIIEKAYWGILIQRDAHTEMLHAMINHFWSLKNESAMEAIDYLSNIVDRLPHLGVEDISDHDVVEKLLKSLNKSFDTLVLTIKGRPDYESLSSAEVIEILISHEEQLEKENGQLDLNSLENLSLDEEQEIMSDYGGSTDEEHENPHSIMRELESLTKWFNNLRQENMYVDLSLEDNLMVSTKSCIRKISHVSIAKASGTLSQIA